jgi:hypothetical protein
MRSRLGIAALVGLLSGVAALAVAVAPAYAGRGRTFREHFTQLPFVSAYTSGRYTLLRTTVQGQVGVVLDELTGSETTVSLPADCPEPDPDGELLGGGWLLEDCTSSRVDLYSLAGGDWRDVPIAAGCLNFDRGQGSSCSLYAIGSDWIAYDESSDRFSDHTVFQNIDSGRMRGDPSNATTLADLSSPTLLHHVCRPLRAPSGGAMVGLVGGFALAFDGAGAVLERCGTHLHRALRSLHEGFVLDTWSTNDAPALVWETWPWRVLTGIFLPSLRRFRVTAPTPRREFAGIPFQTSDRHIYFATIPRSPTARVRVLSAPLPQHP